MGLGVRVLSSNSLLLQTSSFFFYTSISSSRRRHLSTENSAGEERRAITMHSGSPRTVPSPNRFLQILAAYEVASFLLYLSDVEEGGETMFPYENGENMDTGYDYEKCIALKAKPRQGDGLLLYSLLTNGTIDPTSLHGSCPVSKERNGLQQNGSEIKRIDQVSAIHVDNHFPVVVLTSQEKDGLHQNGREIYLII